MSFIGAVNEDIRAVLAGMAPMWKGLPIYVGCSGNFTVERVLARCLPAAELHSNDVSLYSCAVGNALTGKLMDVQVREKKLFEWGFLNKWVQRDPIAQVACLLVCSEWFKWIGRTEPFFVRMEREYRTNFDRLMEGSIKRVEASLSGVAVKSYFAGDVVAYARQIPDGAVFITFPPTYEGGYERIYKHFDEIFDWPKPTYPMFSEESFAELTRLLMSKTHWVTLRDHPVESMRPYLRALIQSSVRSKPVHIYASDPESKVVMPHQKIEVVPWPRQEGEIVGPVSLVKMTQGQMNQLRSLYLNPKIAPAAALVNVGVVNDGKLLGAFSFSQPTMLGGWCDLRDD
jgi:hypothetical protein